MALPVYLAGVAVSLYAVALGYGTFEAYAESYLAEAREEFR